MSVHRQRHGSGLVQYGLAIGAGLVSGTVALLYNQSYLDGSIIVDYLRQISLIQGLMYRNDVDNIINHNEQYFTRVPKLTLYLMQIEL